MKTRRTININLIIFFSLLSLSCQSQQSSLSKLSELNEAIVTEKYPNIDGIIVKKSNKIIIEEYFGEFEKNSIHDTRSAFKSITSLLTGIAIDKNLIKLEDSILKYFPDYEIKNVNDKMKELITVKDLLEMKAGFDCEEFYGIGPNCEDEMDNMDDWVESALNSSMKDKPGLNWSYNSIEPMIMGAIISEASGLSIMDFAKKYLFEPLNISDYSWTISPKGQGMTAGSFFMKPIDMLKIGELVKQKGQWNEIRIVSEEWIESSTECKIDIDFSFVRYSRMFNAKYESAKYGYYWYKEKLEYGDIKTEVLFASGNGGQYIMLLDDYDSIIVFTGRNFNNWKNKLPFEILLKYLIPIMESEK